MKVYEINPSYKIHNLYGFSEPASQKMEILIEMYHNTVVSLSYILFAIIFAIIVTVYYFRSSKNLYAIPFQKSVDALFVFVPIIIIYYLAVPAVGFIINNDKLIAYLDTPIVLLEYQNLVLKISQEVISDEEVELCVNPDGILMMNVKNTAWKYLPSSKVEISVSSLDSSDVPHFSNIDKVLSNGDKYLNRSPGHYSLSYGNHAGAFTSGKIPDGYEQCDLGKPVLCPIFKFNICDIESVRDTIDYSDILNANSLKIDSSPSQKMVIYRLDGSKEIFLKSYDKDNFIQELTMRECLMEQDFMELKSKLILSGDLCKDELASAKYDSYLNSLSFKDLNELWWNYKSGKLNMEKLAYDVSNTRMIEVQKDTYLLSKSIVKDFMKYVNKK